MVKLKVTARVIPEDVYLANVETTIAPHALLRSEKRFCVVVREPENWYIGTLAIEIKKRYESLYKHDLGQIKYLKDNQDDCDLDTELYVADALVDEGRALTDPSDQHVTVKVIQEQGRNVRQGSVVPDLSQSHYLLPERPTRPPVPRFEDLGSNLGKRKPGEDIPNNSVGQKRARLDEIEEDLVTSIEHDAPLRSDVAVSNSQPANSGAAPSPELTWSFSQVGPPTLVQDTSPVVDDEKVNDGQRAESTQQRTAESSGPTAIRTPMTSLQDLNSPELVNNEIRSPLAAASSASKKFLKPRKDVFAEPESDIDDSQMSPDSRDTSRITPRLVPSGRAKGTSRHDKIKNDKTASVGADPEETAIDLRNTPAMNGVATSLNQRSSQMNQVDDQEPTNPQTVSVNGQTDVIMKDINGLNLDSRLTSNQDASTNKSKTIGSLEPNHVMALPHDSQSNYLPVTTIHTAQDAASRSDVDKGSKSLEDGFGSSSGQSARGQRKNKRIVSNGPDQPRLSMELSTPTPDSPSEQLSQALQESARKASSWKDAQAGVVPSKALKQTAEEKSKKMRVRKRKNDLNTEVGTKATTGAKTGEKAPAGNKSTALAVEVLNVKPSEPGSKNVMPHSATTEGTRDAADAPYTSPIQKNNTLMVPAVSQAMREASTDSHVTNSSKTIIPPGMTQEQYDRIVKGNAHLNAPGPKEPSKRRSTPSLRQTSSIEQPVVRSEVPSDKANRAKKAVVPSTASVEAANENNETIDGHSTQFRSKSIPETKTQKTPSKSASAPKPSEAAPNAEDNAARSSIDKEPEVTKGKKASSQAVSESTTSKKAKADSGKAPPALSSIHSTSEKSDASATPNVAATAVQKQPTPTPSTASKATSVNSAKRAVKGSTSTSARLPPSSSSAITTDSASAATPTPKPRSVPSASSKPAQPASALKRTTNTGSVTRVQPTKPANSRPTLAPTFSSARTLQELRTMVNSTNNSTASSPAPSAQRFAQPRKSILNKDDSDSSSSDEESSSDSESSGDRRPTQRSDPKSTPLSKAGTATRNATSTAVPKSRPDPTIRDVSTDDDDDSDDDDDDED